MKTTKHESKYDDRVPTIRASTISTTLSPVDGGGGGDGDGGGGGGGGGRGSMRT